MRFAVTLGLTVLCGASAASALFASIAAAQALPAKPIRFVGIATPGSPSDIIGRALGEPLSRRLGQQIIVDNRPGAGGTIAAGVVARSEPDGTTLLLTTSAQTGMPWMYGNLGFHPIADFSGVAALAELPNVLVVPPQRGWNALRDMIDAAKAKPGSLNFGSGGTGSGTHLCAEKLMLAAGIRANHVPYKGTSEGVIEVIAGRLDWFYAPAAGVVSLVRDGKLKALAVSTRARMPLLPDVQTVAEAGLNDAEYVFWIGLLAPRRTPRAAIDALNTETLGALRLPEMRERLRQLGAEPLAMKPDEFDAFIAADTESTGRIVKAAGIRSQ
ncbi:MAG TPA: tripartite tricarboxylate transporter substrate-binding protein [Burkholderiales bacterium]|nr:tripartite tricarboxylate transporter substrate-binding protein [Burkholderiales bacterium]